MITNETDFSKYYHRGALVLLSLKYPDIIYAKFTGNATELSREVFRRSNYDLSIFTKRRSISEHVTYKYLISVDGYASAWKRIAYIAFTNSVLFKTSSPNMQWFYHKLTPGVNFV